MASAYMCRSSGVLHADNFTELKAAYCLTYCDCSIDTTTFVNMGDVSPTTLTHIYHSLKYDRRLHYQYCVVEFAMTENGPKSVRSFDVDIRKIMALVNYKRVDRWDEVKSKIDAAARMVSRLRKSHSDKDIIDILVDTNKFSCATLA